MAIIRIIKKISGAITEKKVSTEIVTPALMNAGVSKALTLCTYCKVKYLKPCHGDVGCSNRIYLDSLKK